MSTLWHLIYNISNKKNNHMKRILFNYAPSEHIIEKYKRVRGQKNMNRGINCLPFFLQACNYSCCPSWRRLSMRSRAIRSFLTTTNTGRTTCRRKARRWAKHQGRIPRLRRDIWDIRWSLLLLAPTATKNPHFISNFLHVSVKNPPSIVTRH